MRAKMCLAALAVSASLAEAAIAEHEVESLPGWDYALPSKQYSGFISAQDPATVVPGKERFLHYILVLAENNPADAPVVLWSNGGPGCSSLEGYLMEMGPLTPDPSDPQAQRLKRNPYTWNLYANMLYLEHGVGVGYSYGNGGDIQLDDEADGNDVHWFLRNFLYPDTCNNPPCGYNEFAANEFYMTGESYAGIYIPQIADTIRRGNLEQSHHINLMGFMIGNGCSGKDTFNCGDPPDNDDFLMSSGGMQLDFLHGHGLVGRDLFNDIKDTCTGPKPDWGADPQCIGIVMSEPMCGLTIQEFANQYFNAASCMGPVPEEYWGMNITSDGRFESIGGTPAGYGIDVYQRMWNATWWPRTAAMLGEDYVALHGMTAHNTWTMDRPGPDLTDPICSSARDPQNGFQPRPGCGSHENNVDVWPVSIGGDENVDSMGRSVNIACCRKYDSALELLGTIDIYDITDQACSPGELAMGSKEKSAGVLDKIDLTRKMPGSDTRTPEEEPLRDLDPCGGASFNTPYFNAPEVMRALHVDTEGPVADGTAEWAECAREPFFNYTKTVTSHTPTYQQFLVPNMRVTIFSGDVDACVPYLGSMRWVADVAANNADTRAGGSGYAGGDPWPIIGYPWTSWTVDENVAGYFTAYDASSVGPFNFTFATVKGAGHMVPEVKPKQALSLFYRFLNGLPMDYTEPEALVIDRQPVPHKTVASGAAVTLRVAVSKGTAPYLYAWFKDGNQMHGQYGATMTIDQATPADTGSYFVRVAGVLGDTQWSEESVVAVTPAPGCDATESGSAEGAPPAGPGSGVVGFVLCFVLGVVVTFGIKAFFAKQEGSAPGGAKGKGSSMYTDTAL